MEKQEVSREQTNHRETEKESYGGINALSDCRADRNAFQHGKFLG